MSSQWQSAALSPLSRALVSIDVAQRRRRDADGERDGTHAEIYTAQPHRGSAGAAALSDRPLAQRVRAHTVLLTLRLRLRALRFTSVISVHLLLVTYGLATGTPHAVVGSSHPPGARLVPYFEVLQWRWLWRVKPADGCPCSRSSADNTLLDLLACGLCAPAKSSARDSTPAHLLLW